MAMMNPKGRANYEPNSWGAQGGPRENPARGFTSFAEDAEGPKQRVRSESFADHYSQARQFFISQTPPEQAHLANALVFELSKVERPDIRARLVSHLLNIDDGLANKVADGLGLEEMPDAAEAAREPITDLPPSNPLSIAKRYPSSFKGRKLGVLLTDGADAALFAALVAACQKEGADLEVVAPKIGGALLSDGQRVPAKQKIDGGPSVLYDAVTLLVSEEGAALLAKDAPTKDFISDAFAHCKFIAYSGAAEPLLEMAGVADKLDEGFLALSGERDAAKFIKLCRNLRLWSREPGVDADADATSK
jgi:catalase